jgi:cation transport regulator ChaB
MPFNQSSPPAAVKSLPGAAKRIFISAFNSAFKQYGEQRSFQIGWAAVKRKYKKVGGKWVAKSDSTDAEDDMDPVDIELTEVLDYNPAKIRMTPDGYLVAEPRIARMGIQLYKGIEVGRPDMDTVRVFRPETEVFHADALKSLAWKPITLDHPDEHVDAANWKQYGIGQLTGDIARDGEFIRVPLILMDAGAINAWKEGKAQLSVGYGAKLVWGEGKTTDGQVYDAMQTEIRANHVAVVQTARGGPKLRIGDRRGKDKPMTEVLERTINIDGVNVSLEDKDGQILQRHLDKLASDAAAFNTKLADAMKVIEGLHAKAAEITKVMETKDGEIAAIKKQLSDAQMTPQKVDEMVSVRMDIKERAKRVLGDRAMVDGKTDIQIKREVVEQLMGGEATKLMSDDAITGAFHALTATGTGMSDGIRRTVDAFRGPPAHNPMQAAAQAYNKRNEDLQNAWKAKPAS